jgi:UDP-N-acetylglucosamine--N-acetylmuramyl-(pentapeptide) pyrophosphoryl-undecaprenol N-acetylglucosamine transferase
VKEKEPYRIVISGGGTGGHIYPAIAIAKTFQSRFKDAEILFVGAQGRMEMQKVPESGYKIIGLWISGLQRRLTFSNLMFPIKLVSSVLKSFSILKSFRPHAVVGVGGYASGPLLYSATKKKIPSLIQEQNSYAGLTNKMLSKNVDKICVAYEGMDKYFDKGKIILTGNPVRNDLHYVTQKREEAYRHFGLRDNRKTILILGGSLGARI